MWIIISFCIIFMIILVSLILETIPKESESQKLKRRQKFERAEFRLKIDKLLHSLQCDIYKFARENNRLRVRYKTSNYRTCHIIEYNSKDMDKINSIIYTELEYPHHLYITHYKLNKEYIQTLNKIKQSIMELPNVCN